MAYTDDLLEQAEHLAGRESVGKPRQASLRRAISAAYYAVFHQLTMDGAALCAPANPAGLRGLVKRAFEHGRMREVCKKVNGGGSLNQAAMGLLEPATRLSAQLRSVTRSFVVLQEARHIADYDLSQSLSRAYARSLLVEARSALTNWRAVSGTEEANVFLAAMLHDRLGR